MKKSIFTKDWLVGLLIALFFATLMLFNVSFLENLERINYDSGVMQKQFEAGMERDIAIVAIDDESLKQVGRWPWDRNIQAELIRLLQPAKVIGMQIFLSEPTQNSAMSLAQNMSLMIIQSKLRQKDKGLLLRELNQQLAGYDYDAILSHALQQSGKVYMPMYFAIGEPLGRPDSALPPFVARNKLSLIRSGPYAAQPFYTYAIDYPLDIFGRNTAGIGHLNILQDSDGAVRSELLLLDHYGELYPSLSLLLASRYLNIPLNEIQVDLQQRFIRIGRLTIHTDDFMRMRTSFYQTDGKPAFKIYSAIDVLTGKVPPETFAKKIVLIGPTATGLGNDSVTPVSEAMNTPILLANNIASILNQDFYIRPDWTGMVEWVLFLLVTLYLMFGLKRLSAGQAAITTFVLLTVLIYSGNYFIANQQVWLQTMTPALMLFSGYLILNTRRFLLTERAKTRVESDSAESNRMLGLTLQGQGQLDMAMDKFRKLPVDDTVLELIYNLAADFERKRQFSKAVNAYDYILQFNPDFREIVARRKRAQNAEETIIVGGRGTIVSSATMIMDGDSNKPTLGRYEIERELGRGAMGTVFLGKDPKINRTVAIKTMDLSAEFDEQQLQTAKERFFREAETAGRLNHPNIVTIYDIGEEQDLAYIAMELLKGKDLSDVLREGQRPLSWCLNLIAQCAEALDYAHKQDVVHRDIKPENVMYDEASGEIKITDFGIARITASNKTRTGTIMGTPSYMSPEQLAGTHVDGRSDLFSLGVMMYEMISGQLPFEGDSMAALVFAITNGSYKDIKELREVPDCVSEVITKALQKALDERYQNGADMAGDIRMCLQMVGE